MPDSPFHRAMVKWGKDGFIPLLRSAGRDIFLHSITNSLLDFSKLSQEEVQQRCSKRGQLWKHDNPEIKSRILSSQKVHDQHFHARKEGYDWSPRTVCEITDAKVIGWHGLVMNSNGTFIYDKPRSIKKQFYTWRPKLHFRAVNHQRDILSSSNKSAQFETAMSMVTHLEIYGHWLLEYLPMLLHLSMYEDATGSKPDIIVDKDPPDWMLESLRILGYPSNRVTELESGFVGVERLVLPFASILGETPAAIRLSPVEHHWLREKSLEAVNGTDTSKENRYYISRQGTDRRYVTNFEEIKSVLDEFSVEIVRPEKLSFEEQVRKFSKGGLFVGPRGSGLHNTIFAKDASVVEIFPPTTRFHIQYLLDISLGHDYTYVFGSEYEKKRSSEEDKHLPFRLNPDALRSALKQVI